MDVRSFTSYRIFLRHIYDVIQDVKGTMNSEKVPRENYVHFGRNEDVKTDVKSTGMYDTFYVNCQESLTSNMT